MKKTISSILCIFLCFCLCSCGVFVWRGSGHEPDVPTSPPETQTTEPTQGEQAEGEYEALAALPAVDMDGATAVITAVSASDFISDGDDMYDAALSARTAAVEEKYNVNIAVSERTADKLYAELAEHIGGGTYYSDLIAIPMSWVGKFARDGYIVPVSDYAEIDPAAKYYTATDAFTDRGAVYALPGSAASSAKYSYCVYFNKHLADEAALDLYGEVSALAWTWSRFNELVSDRTGAGFACGDGEQFVNAVFTSCGMSYTTYADGVRTCNYTGERADGVMAVADSVYNGGARADADYPAGLFSQGGCLFYIGTVGEAGSFSDMGDSYGILPLPTYSEGEEYRTYVSGDMPVLCIPTGSAAGKYAPVLYEALNAASVDLDEAYVTYLANYSLRDGESAECVRTAGEAMTYDYAYVFGPKHNDAANCTYWCVQQAVLFGKRHETLYKAYLPDFNKFVG